MKKVEKLKPTGDYSGLDGTESHGLLIQDPVTLHFVRLCLAAANGEVQAWLLYNVGYSLLLSGDRNSSIQVLKILEKLDENLSALLSFKLSIDLPNLPPD